MIGVQKSIKQTFVYQNMLRLFFRHQYDCQYLRFFINFIKKTFSRKKNVSFLSHFKVFKICILHHLLCTCLKIIDINIALTDNFQYQIPFVYIDNITWRVQRKNIQITNKIFYKGKLFKQYVQSINVF